MNAINAEQIGIAIINSVNVRFCSFDILRVDAPSLAVIVGNSQLILFGVPERIPVERRGIVGGVVCEADRRLGIFIGAKVDEPEIDARIAGEVNFRRHVLINADVARLGIGGERIIAIFRVEEEGQFGVVVYDVGVLVRPTGKVC